MVRLLHWLVMHQVQNSRAGGKKKVITLGQAVTFDLSATVLQNSLPDEIYQQGSAKCSAQSDMGYKCLCQAGK